MVDIEVKYPSRSKRKLGYTDVIIVHVRNRDPHRVLAECRVTVQPNGYHRFATATLKPIPAQQWGEVELKVDVQNPGRPNIRKLCPEFTVEVGQHKHTVQVQIANYNRGIVDYVPQRVGVKESEVREFNILMFGTAGASKSSFVNTVMTMLQVPDETKMYRVAEIGGSADHATRKLHCFDVSEIFPEVTFNLWDTWGVDRKSYSKDIVNTLVDGKLPQNWGMTNSFEKFRERFEKMGETVRTQMHAIMFFVPQAMLTDLDEEETARIQEMFQSLIAKLYNPLVILSKVDEVCPQIRRDPLGAVKEVEDLRKKTASLFKIGLNSVRYTVNYTEETERTFGIEALAYENIESALQHCESFVQSRIMRFGTVKASDATDKDGLIWPEDSDED